jgi:hypothetical protein
MASDRLDDARSDRERREQRDRIFEHAKKGESFDAGIVLDLLRDIAYLEGRCAGNEVAILDKREHESMAAIVREVANARDLYEAVYKPGQFGGEPDFYCVVCQAGLGGKHAPDCLVARARALVGIANGEGGE